MSDLISRQAAIDAIERAAENKRRSRTDGKQSGKGIKP